MPTAESRLIARAGQVLAARRSGSHPACDGRVHGRLRTDDTPTGRLVNVALAAVAVATDDTLDVILDAAIAELNDAARRHVIADDASVELLCLRTRLRGDRAGWLDRTPASDSSGALVPTGTVELAC